MSATNPHLTNIDRAPREFGHLMKAMPARFPEDHAMSTDERQQAEAAIRHASNAGGTLMDGLEVIGQLLFSAGTNDAWPMDASDLCRIGMLIKHIAVEAQFMQDQTEELQFSLDNDAQRAAATPAPAKKGGAA